MSGLENFAFEAIYYLLTAMIAIVLVTVTGLSIIAERRTSSSIFRKDALGIGLAAIGATVSILGGVSLDTLAKSGSINGLFYQQSHFLIFYGGFALIFYGLTRMLLGATVSLFLEKKKQLRQRFLILLWSSFVSTVIVSSVYLLNPSTYTIIYSGGSLHVAQQQIFFLPLIFTCVLGSLAVPLGMIGKEGQFPRKMALWFGVFSIFTLIGVLREATLIPSSGNPLIDLLVAFGPFAIASLCLLFSSKSLLLKGVQGVNGGDSSKATNIVIGDEMV
jgi:hypothetical protein